MKSERAWASIPDQVLSHAARRPDAIAVEQGDDRLTYDELATRMERYASLIAERLGGSEPLVALCLKRTVDLPVWMLAVIRAGAAYLPLDATLPPARTAAVLKQARPALILASAVYRSALPDTDIPLIAVEALTADRTPVTPLPRSFHPAALAYVIYTSGSTGTPKGVEIEQRSVTTLLAAMSATPGLGAGERMLALTRISFDISVLELFLPLVVGGTAIIVGERDALDPHRLAALIAQARPDMVQATPAGYRALLESGWDGFAPRLLCGGEAMTPDLAARLLPRCDELWNVYGPTETTVWSTTHRISSGASPISIGRPIDGETISILDETLAPVPAGATGEIVIGGPGVARGYRGAPELTAERFVTVDGKRVYRTGDIGRIDNDGLLHCLGRSDDQVKVRGFRVELGDIESALAHHPGIAWSAVRAWQDGEGQTSLAAYVVPRKERPVAAQDLASHLKERLPPYMVPDRFVMLSEMPKTPSGKIDRKALPIPWAIVDTVEVETHATTQDALAAIWMEILSLTSVEPDDDFFDLGGYSLLTVRLQRRIEERFGRIVELATLMRASSLTAMADLIDGPPVTASDDGIFLLNEAGSRSPLFWLDSGPLIRRMARSMSADQPVFALNLTTADEAELDDGPVDLAAVATILRKRLVRAQPTGPYYLGGWCRWGVVAYELACQLRERGRSVGLLVLLDAEAPQRLGTRWLHGLRRSWRGRQTPQSEAPSFSERVELASRDHPVRSFQGPALLVRPETSGDDGGWRPKIAGEFVVNRVPGDHESMVRPPNVAHLSKVIERHLHAALAIPARSVIFAAS